MTRSLIADPDVAAKTAADHADRIRPRIGVKEGCRRVTLARSLACSVNPEVAQSDPRAHPPMRAEDRPVIGAGPGGPKVARVEAARGFDVTVLERAGRVDGQMHDHAAVKGRRIGSSTSPVWNASRAGWARRSRWTRWRTERRSRTTGGG